MNTAKVSGSVKSIPKPRMKKKRKKKSKIYFGTPVQNAIIRYNDSKNPVIQNRIYREHIQKAFDKLAENVIHTYKTYYFDVPYEDVKDLPNLRLSPPGVVPQRERRPRSRRP